MITERKKICILSRHQHLSQMNVPATTEPSSSSVFSSLLGTIYLLNSVSSYITQATTAWKGGRNPSYQQTNCKIISWYWEGKRLQRHWRERLWNSNNCTEALGQLSGKKSNTYPGSKRVHKSITILLFIRKHTQPLGFLHFFPFLLSTPIRNTQLRGKVWIQTMQEYIASSQVRTPNAKPKKNTTHANAQSSLGSLLHFYRMTGRIFMLGQS